MRSKAARGSGIPAAILLFNKGKTHGDVLFIDASRDFKDAKNQNILTEEHLEKIVATHKSFQTVEKNAYRATLESQLASVRGKMTNHLKDLGL
ncbi:MAG: hypothetical protein EAZ84_12215 [Verrucomicrobia bacterium]|nr:MAG: hypothetical protein EAZ84_12215 [Verrucomicrobiota bacterium]TAE88788.1 MAG: hypothetical protein EAZ82_03440 [Verrucomicrobiota bacterium]TAF26598.1 MAG: hypothetical protein EAZ71_04965 [Verrucomicrobiota bacterium]